MNVATRSGALGGILLLAACQSGGLALPQRQSSTLGLQSSASQAIAGHRYRVLYAFKGAPDGRSPLFGLTAVNGLLYGTTGSGGRGAGDGNGTVFDVDTAGKETVLYRFKGSPDGSYPLSGLTDLHGTLYGATWFGGDAGCAAGGCGIVFSMTHSGHEKVLYRFLGSPYGDGENPIADLIKVKDVLYGVTANGGNTVGNFGTTSGTVFSVTPSGQEKMVYKFQPNSTDGLNPYGGLLKRNGVIYGTTLNGGQYGDGTVFSLTTQGREKVLYSFKGGSDGAFPEATLIAVNDVFYGTTFEGGSGCGVGCGTVFSVTTSGAEKILYRFKGGANDGSGPAGLVAVGDKFYGTTYYGVGGSSCPCGTVFSVTPAGQEKPLHIFSGSPDGQNPIGNLTVLNGRLYGVTRYGGLHKRGTIFRLVP